jgi:DNA primase
LIPQDFIDELLARTDIVDVVEQRVKLKKQGQNYSGLCPFHNEKTPSFSVSQDKQFYYCFGCQASGNALKFIMEFDRLDFVPAVEVLAANAGMEVPQVRSNESPEKVERRKSIYEILEQSSDFYKDQLRHHPSKNRAVDYLKDRGLSGEIARDFMLGFAPPGWDNLYAELAKTNLERDLLIESGMVIDNRDEDKTYDRFRDRIMFPIRDIRGRVIAFGGRIIGDGKPKYLNSPETPVFHKGRELYGLYEARRRTRKLDHVLIVEGYMDVVALAQHGINCAVATLGTATSEEHIDRLFRMVSSLVFCFDGDSAGRNAAWKALVVTLPYMRDGRSAAFLFLPDGEDPDSLVRHEGREGFERRLDEAPHLPDVFFDKLESETDTSSLDGKAALAGRAMPMIATIPEGVFKQLMIQRLSDLTGLPTERLIAAHGSATKAQGVSSRSWDQSPAPPPTDYGPPDDIPADYGMSETIETGNRRDRELADTAVALLLRSPELAIRFDSAVYTTFEGSSDCGLLTSVVTMICEQNLESPSLLLAGFQDRPEFDRLRELAEREALLSVEHLPAEYEGIIQRLVDRAESESKQRLMKELVSKPREELTDEDKEMIRNLTRSGARVGRQG